MSGRLSRWLAPGLLSILVGCVVVPAAPPPATRTITSVEFTPKLLPRGVVRSNATLASDFLDLTFRLESGQALNGLLRYEGPVGVFVRSPALKPYDRDLATLIRRLRQEAGVDIRRVYEPSTAQIHIEAVPSRQIQRVYPGAACFIIPGETSWQSFRARPSRDRLRWSDQRTLGTTAIFLPSDSSPQDIRDCLHEEIGQALGPANDVYRLADSVFNDDNFHSILTPFDMLMLRVLYSPDLSSGMPKALVAGRLPAILNRINPTGRGVGSIPRAPSSVAWKRAIETAMTRSNSHRRRLNQANTAVNIATGMLPHDHRLGVSLLTRGRLLLRDSPSRAASDFQAAHQLFRDRVGSNDIRTAQAALHLAVIALQRQDFGKALTLIDSSLPTAKAAENAVLVSGFYAIRAEALAALGRAPQAKAARVEHLKWARYAFGDNDGKIASAQAQIETFAPSPGTAPAGVAR